MESERSLRLVKMDESSPQRRRERRGLEGIEREANSASSAPPRWDVRFIAGSPDLKSFTAEVEWDAETGLFVGIVPGLRGAHTEGATFEELRLNLQEVTELCLEEDG